MSAVRLTELLSEPIETTVLPGGETPTDPGEMGIDALAPEAPKPGTTAG